jgi:hypothetical protein
MKGEIGMVALSISMSNNLLANCTKIETSVPSGISTLATKPRLPIAIEYEQDGHNQNDSCALPALSSKSLRSMPPNDAKRVLLHSCCSPCSGAMIEQMTLSGLEVRDVGWFCLVCLALFMCLRLLFLFMLLGSFSGDDFLLQSEYPPSTGIRNSEERK